MVSSVLAPLCMVLVLVLSGQGALDGDRSIVYYHLYWPIL